MVEKLAVSKAQHVILVANLYPDEVDPSKGTFIRTIFQNIQPAFDRVDVVALANTSGGKGPKARAYVRFYVDVLRHLVRYPDALFYPHYVIHSAPPFLLAAALGLRRRIVSHTHGSDIVFEGNPGPLVRRLKRFLSGGLMRRSARIIAPSAYFRDVIVAKYGIPAERMAVSPSGGIDIGVFHPAAEVPAARETLHLGFVGRLTEDKGIHDFLQLIVILEERGVPVRATIVGNGPESAAIQAASSDRIVHHSYLPHDELAKIYRVLDFFVFPTRRDSESLGLVGIEAMACGTPVVVYDGAGPSTYVDHGKTGFLVPRGDVQGLADRVIEYSRWGPERRAEMRQSAVRQAKDYDTEEVNRTLVRILKDVGDSFSRGDA